MPFSSYVGEISNIYKTEHAEWKIPNYFALSQRTDNWYTSLPFKFLNAVWVFRIFPNGTRASGSVGNVNIYMVLINPICSNSTITFTVGIKGRERNIQLGPETVFIGNSLSFGWKNFVTRINLQRFLKEQSNENTLVIYCDAASNQLSTVDTASQTASDDNLAILCRDLGDLLQSGRKSDISLKVKNHVFKVHRLILEARSPVFAAMFNHDMKETRNKSVEIDDCDPESFQDFLQYIYTGQLGNLSQENVIQLFIVADKYGILELKDQCAEFMAQDLSIDNVCDVLALADRHNQTQLKKSAKELLIKNMKKILLSDKWKSFMVENPLLSVEILTQVVPDDNH